MIHTPPAGDFKTPGDAIPADTVGAVIDACDITDLEALRAGYQRIAQAKALQKSAAPDLGAFPNSTRTLGIIFALRAAVSLEDLAEELDRLN
ncbi:MAG: hypothetical protein ACREMR_09010, partial [Gemmatimonadales bacterium]